VVVYARNHSYFSDIPNVTCRDLPDELGSLDRIAIRNQFRYALHSEILKILFLHEEVEPTIWIDCDTVFRAPLNLRVLEKRVFFHSALMRAFRLPEYKVLVRDGVISDNLQNVYDFSVLHIPKKFLQSEKILKDLRLLYLEYGVCWGRWVSLSENLSKFPLEGCEDSVKHLSREPVKFQIPKVSVSYEVKRKLSVILTTSSRRLLGHSFLPMAIVCCEHQTYTDFEVIVVAPPSVASLRFDKSEKALGKAIDRSRYKLVNYEGCSPWEARNVGLSKSCGEIISIFDDDNFYGPNYLSQVVDSLNQCDMVYGSPSSLIYDLVSGEWMRSKITVCGTLSFRRNYAVQKGLLFLPPIKKWDNCIESEARSVGREAPGGEFVYVRSLGNISPVRGRGEIDGDMSLLRSLVGNSLGALYSEMREKIQSLVGEQ